MSTSETSAILALEGCKEGAVLRTQVGAVEEIGARLQSAVQRLLPSPASDSGVIAREQHSGHGRAAVLRRSRVLRILEKRAGERIVGGGIFAAKDTGNEPTDCVDDDQGSDLAAGE